MFVNNTSSNIVLTLHFCFETSAQPQCQQLMFLIVIINRDKELLNEDSWSPTKIEHQNLSQNSMAWHSPQRKGPFFWFFCRDVTAISSEISWKSRPSTSKRSPPFPNGKMETKSRAKKNLNSKTTLRFSWYLDVLYDVCFMIWFGCGP